MIAKNIAPVNGAVKSAQPLAACANDPILKEHTQEIRRLGKRVIEDIIEIGRRLTECKKIVGHGNWLSWIEREFQWCDRTAERFIRIYELSRKFDTLSNLEVPITGLYLLAAPSTPESAQIEVIERAEKGEVITTAEIRGGIGAHKAPASVPQAPLPAILRPAWADGRVAAPPDRNAPISPPPDLTAPIRSVLPPPPAPIARPTWPGGNAVDPEDAAAERKMVYADGKGEVGAPAIQADTSAVVSPLRSFIQRVRAIANEANTAAFDDVLLTNNARNRLRKAVSNIRYGLTDLSAVAEQAERNAAKAEAASKAGDAS